jgi:hypothetical protein
MLASASRHFAIQRSPDFRFIRKTWPLIGTSRNTIEEELIHPKVGGSSNEKCVPKCVPKSAKTTLVRTNQLDAIPLYKPN